MEETVDKAKEDLGTDGFKMVADAIVDLPIEFATRRVLTMEDSITVE